MHLRCINLYKHEVAGSYAANYIGTQILYSSNLMQYNPISNGPEKLYICSGPVIEKCICLSMPVMLYTATDSLLFITSCYDQLSLAINSCYKEDTPDDS